MSQRKTVPPCPDRFSPGYVVTPNPDAPFGPWNFSPPPFTVEIIEPERPAWIAVIERILSKAYEHKKAGREGVFSQVLVPKSDFEALKEFFGDDEPLVWTPIGLVSIHPVNPDGATFVD